MNGGQQSQAQSYVRLVTGELNPFKQVTVKDFEYTVANLALKTSGVENLSKAAGSAHKPSSNEIVEVGLGFGGLNEHSSGNAVTPDVQVAAGPSNVVEMVNDEGKIWTGQGVQVSVFSLTTFFQTGGDTISNPRILYDNQSGTWFALILDQSENDIVLASSTTNNPAGNWTLFRISAGSNCPESPVIGISSEVVVVSANDYSSPGCLNTFGDYVGAQYWIIQKSSLVAGSTANIQYSTPNPQEFSIFPSDSLSPTSALYMVSDGYGNGSSIFLFSVTGEVPASTVQVTNLTVAAITSPPGAVQPGTNVLIDTIGASVSDAAWYQGSLWLVLSDACTPSGDTQTRSCIRLIDVDTNTSSVVQDFDYGSSGEYYYYPALSIDSYGDLGIVFGYSSSSVYPSIAASVRAINDPPNTLRPPFVLKEGAYPDFGAFFGSYLGAAIDPSNPETFWVAGVYYPDSYWYTYISSFKMVPTYSVTFAESGLPSGTTWGINFNSTTFSSNTSSIELNGFTVATYPWSITTSVIDGSAGVRYVSSQSSGSLDITANVSESISYSTQYLVGVGANQTGLGETSPENSSWYDAGSIVNISATSVSPNQFAWWSSSSPSLLIANVYSEITTVTINGVGDISANFAPIIISLSPFAGEVSQGSSLFVTANVRGVSQPVSLSVSGVPTGINASLELKELTISPVGASVNLTISPSLSAIAGSFPITILATGSSGESLPTIYELTVRAVVVLNLSYSVQDGASGSPVPQLYFIFNGTSKSANLGVIPSSFYVDADSVWSVTSQINGSMSGERWATNYSTKNLASSSRSVAFVYYHQYLAIFDYRVTGGGFGYLTPSVNSTEFGKAVELQVNSQVWIDSGSSWSLANPLLGSSSTQRWETNNSTNGTIESPSTYSFDFYRQSYVTLDYATLGSAVSSSLPEINYTTFGITSTTMGNSSAWVDWGGSYSFPAELPAPNSSVRSVATTPAQTSGIIFSSSKIVMLYQTQYYLTLTSQPPGSGSVSPPSGWYESGAVISLKETNGSGWADEGWIGIGAGSYSGSDEAVSIILGSPVTETALYSPLYFISVAKGGSVSYIYGTSSGIVAGGTSQSVYVPLGTQLRLTANPASILYDFKGWTGSASGALTHIQVSTNSPMYLEANFGYNYPLFAIVGTLVIVIALVLILGRRMLK